MGSRTARKPVAELFGSVVAERRKRLGMSQEELAEQVGISQESLSRMEKGYISPRFERLDAFAAALGCSLPELFGESASAELRAAAIEKILLPLPEKKQRDLVRIMEELAGFCRQ